MILQHAPCPGGECKRPDSILVLALCFFPVNIDRTGDIHHAAVNIFPAQAQQFARAQAGEDLEPIGVDIGVGHALAVKCGGV